MATPSLLRPIPSALAPPRRDYLALALWVGFLLLIRSPGQSVMPYDEGYYAQQARWMVETGDWLPDQWWGMVIYDRTVGLQWLIAAAYSLLGVSVGAARLPGAIACGASVLLTYAIGRRCVNPAIAWWGAAILAVTPIWMQAGRLATQDVPLTAMELLGIWALLRTEESQRHRFWWAVLAGSTVGLAFMLKGVMIVPVVAALLPYLVLDHRRHRHLANGGLYLGLALGFVPAALWLGLSVQRYGWLPLQNLFGKVLFLAESDFHQAGPFYYFWNIPANGFPWPLLAVAGLGILWRRPTLAQPLARPWLWLGYPLALLGMLTLFKTRTWYYPLQILPFLSLWAAVTLCTLGRRYGQGRDSKTVLGLSGLLAGVATIFLGAGVVALVRPDWVPLVGAWRYGLVAIAAGLGWWVPLAVYWGDRRRPVPLRRRSLWQWGWLMGPWGAIALLYGTGLWGDYNPEYRQALSQPPLAEVVQAHPIHLIHSSGYGEATVLITFETPSLGQRVTDWQTLPPGSYAWIWATDLATLPPTVTPLGAVQEWRLVQIPAPAP